MRNMKINALSIPEGRKVVIAKNQKEYNTLFGVLDLINSNRQVMYTMMFELTFEEIFKLLQTRRLWYQQIVNVPSKDPRVALENESKFQPMNISVDNPLNDTSDDLTTVPAVPLEVLTFIEKYHHMRIRNPELKDKLEDKGQLMADALIALFKSLELTDTTAEPDRASEQCFAIALAALRLSRHFQLMGK